MVNQQLLDYIKQQLEQGVGKERIKSTLMANGWTEADINEAFALLSDSAPTLPPSINPPPSYSREISPTQKPKFGPIKIIIGIIIIVLLGAGITLATGIWDPLWNPFRPSPEKVMAKMIEKMDKVKTLHLDTNFELDIIEPDIESKFV